MAVTILVVGLLVFFGHFLAGLFERTKIPDVLVLMFAGILLGPVSHVVGPSDFGRVGPVFTTLALILILFEGGIELNIRALRSGAADTLLVSFATMLLTALVVSHLADVLLPLDFTAALFIGSVLGGTSAAVVVPLTRVLKPSPGPTALLLLESAVTDVFLIVVALGLLQALAPGEGGAAVATPDGGRLVLDVVRSFLMAGLVGAAGAFLWSAILDKVRLMPNTVFTTVAYACILYGLAELWGYSGPITTLAFGLGVANLPNISKPVLARVFTFPLTTFDQHERAIFGEAVFLVKTFFFVYLGVSMTFTDWRAVATGLLLAAGIFVARVPVVRLLANPATTTRRDAALMTVLVPKGLSAAVLASLPAQLGVPNAEILQGTVYAVVFFSIVACAMLVFSLERGMLDPLLRLWLSKFPAALDLTAADAPSRTEGVLPANPDPLL